MFDLKELFYVKAMGNTKNNKAYNIKHLVRDILPNKKYDLNTHHKLIRYDSFASHTEFTNSLDFFTNYESKEIKPMLVKRFFSNIIEKFIVFTHTEKQDFITDAELRDYHNMIINSKTPDSKENFLAYIMFNIAHEQMIFQERNIQQYIFRTLSLFKNCKVSKQRFIENTGLELEKFIVLVWVLYVIVTKDKNAIVRVGFETFKNTLKEKLFKSISINDIELFFDFIAIERDTFQEKYFYFRKDKHDNLISYDKLATIDNFLPKVSFYYPFIKSNDSNFIHLTSYTAFEQFLHFERVFEIITGNDSKYRSDILGDLYEDYIANLFMSFKEKQTCIKYIYKCGNEEYGPKGSKYRFPDIIIGGKDFILFIESKTSAFNLKNVLHNFNKENFKNLQEAIDKSEKNINNYLIHNPHKIDNLDDKKIYKFVSFNTVSSSMLSILTYANFLNLKGFNLIDLSSIEYFTHIEENINISEILDDYLESVKDNQKTSNLDHFCNDNFTINKNDYEMVFDNLIREHIHK